MRSILRQPIERVFYFGLALLGLVYVLNSWSPSSYGYFLRQVEPQNSGVVWGEPRPVRSDEWAVVTPLTQATVNNGFKRYNATSFYNEDLRINYGLPIYDWGMFFKPTMWGYLFLSPAKAYSLQWYLTFVLFVVGYFKLFKQIGIREELSIILSFSLFFTGATQFWWDEKGPVYAFFPLITYFLISKVKIWVKLVMFYWLGVAWLITDFYPPLVISLAFIGGLLFVANIKLWCSIKNALLLLITSIFTIGTALLYLKDYLINTSKTIYPGHRSFSGGGVNWQEWSSQIFPFSTFNSHFETIYNINISEVGAIGFAFILILLVHLDFSSVRKYDFKWGENRTLILLVLGLILTNAWMVLPIPAWAGKALLWNNVHPNRMVYAAGVLLGMVSLLFLQNLNYVVNLKRAFIYCSIVMLQWWVLKYKPIVLDAKGFSGLEHNYTDFYLLVAVFVSYLLIYRFRISAIHAFTSTSLIASVIVFFGFNPIQSSEAIFATHPNAKKRFDASLDDKSGTLAIAGYPGATLNGLGYKSVTHVTAVPDLKLWKSKFPDMPDSEFGQVFNRYSHIHLSSVSKPTTSAPDVVEVPISKFRKVEYFPVSNDIEYKVLNVNNNSKVGGSVKAGQNGKLVTFSPLIGTYNGTSNGNLGVLVCIEERCRNGNIDLKDKADNQYVKIKLSSPLDVKLGDVINYQLTLHDASNQLALWSAKNMGDVSIISAGKVEHQKLSVGLELGYDNE